MIKSTKFTGRIFFIIVSCLIFTIKKFRKKEWKTLIILFKQKLNLLLLKNIHNHMCPYKQA